MPRAPPWLSIAHPSIQRGRTPPWLTPINSQGDGSSVRRVPWCAEVGLYTHQSPNHNIWGWVPRYSQTSLASRSRVPRASPVPGPMDPVASRRQSRRWASPFASAAPSAVVRGALRHSERRRTSRRETAYVSVRTSGGGRPERFPARRARAHRSVSSRPLAERHAAGTYISGAADLEA